MQDIDCPDEVFGDDSSSCGEASDMHGNSRDDEPCAACGSCSSPKLTLLCDGCPRAFHMSCLEPPISEVPNSEWFCAVCVKTGNGLLLRDASGTEIDMSEETQRRSLESAITERGGLEALSAFDWRCLADKLGITQFLASYGLNSCTEGRRLYEQFLEHWPPKPCALQGCECVVMPTSEFCSDECVSKHAKATAARGKRKREQDETQCFLTVTEAHGGDTLDRISRRWRQETGMKSVTAKALLALNRKHGHASAKWTTECQLESGTEVLLPNRPEADVEAEFRTQYAAVSWRCEVKLRGCGIKHDVYWHPSPVADEQLKAFMQQVHIAEHAPSCSVQCVPCTQQEVILAGHI